MKYTYAYKTSDGVRHEESMNAASREEVFAALRKQGIKAIKVVAADGSKANGEVRGVRKRVVVLAVVMAAFITGLISYFFTDRAQELEPFLASYTRRQVIGDAAIIDKGIRTGWSDVFSSEGDRFLASFAIPGAEPGVRNTSVENITEAIKFSSTPLGDDSIEAQQIKSIVEGLKIEARNYIKAGGSIVTYGKRLIERQEAEIAIYKRVETEVLKARKEMSYDEFISFYEKRNDELRNLGIRPITLPR